MIIPGPAFAWHDYTYREWDWHGSGRDYPFSYYIDRYYTSGYAGFSMYDFDESPYINFINNAPPPALVPLSLSPVTQVPFLTHPDTDAFTVNVPNSHGGYTPVVIKRSGSGYVGPQGEYYPDFPKVSQLKLMYGQ